PHGLEDPAQRARFEREHRAPALQAMHGSFDLAIRDGTHVAQLLGQDEVGVESLELGLVERVDAAAGVERARDVAVDLTAVAPLVARAAPGHGGAAWRLRPGR